MRVCRSTPHLIQVKAAAPPLSYIIHRTGGEERELIMSYRTILSLAAAAVLSAACISAISTDALARAGGRVGVNHARVGAYHGGVAHRGIYRGTYANRGIYRGAAVGVGAAAVGVAAARAYNNNYGYSPTYYGGTGYYQQQPYYGSYQQPYYGSYQQPYYGSYRQGYATPYNRQWWQF